MQGNNKETGRKRTGDGKGTSSDEQKKMKRIMASDVQTVQRINQAQRNLSKSGDIREEMAMVMAPHANWEQYLVPALITIALLGELMLISTQADFTLEKKPPKDGFKLLKYPGSFRACLVQVTNEGWEAFNTAQKNMDQIRLLSGNVPENLRKSVQVLLRGDKADIEDLLPVELGAIKHTADKCLSLAQAVEARFVGVMALAGELLEACVNAKGQYEHELRETVINLKVAEEHKTAIEEEKKNAKEAYDTMKKSLQDAEKDYKSALDSFPSGWDMIGMNFVEGITNAVTTVMDGMAKTFTGQQGSGKGGKAKGSKGNASANGPDSSAAAGPTLDRHVAVAYSKVIIMQTHIELLTSTYMDDDDLRANSLQGSDVMTTVKANISRIEKDLSKVQPSEVQDQALKMAKTAKNVCNKLAELKKDFHEDSEGVKSVVKALGDLHTDVMALSMEGKMMVGANATNTVSPNQAAWKPQTEPAEGGRAAEMATQNARFKAECSVNHLKNSQEMYNKSCDRLKESTERLADIMGEIAKLDMQKIDFEKIKEVLVKGIRALGELREQWSKLVAFFQMMSNIIECCLNVSLKGFLEYAETSSERSIGGYTISNLRKDLIYQQAFESAKIAYLVNMISGSYVEVSSKYLMDKIAGLGKLLALDPEKDASKIQQEMFNLTNGCREAQEGIADIVQTNKANFDKTINKRMNKIKVEMTEALPTTENTSSVSNRIQAAVEKSKAQVEKVDFTTSNLDLDDFA